MNPARAGLFPTSYAICSLLPPTYQCLISRPSGDERASPNPGRQKMGDSDSYQPPKGPGELEPAETADGQDRCRSARGRLRDEEDVAGEDLETGHASRIQALAWRPLLPDEAPHPPRARSGWPSPARQQVDAHLAPSTSSNEGGSLPSSSASGPNCSSRAEAPRCRHRHRFPSPGASGSAPSRSGAP